MTDNKEVYLRKILQELKKPLIIGIAGDSGSGKTTYSNGIKRMLGTDIVQTIHMDGYHKENREQRKVSGRLPLDPLANRFDLLVEHLQQLKEWKTIPLPVYNHKTGDFDSPVPFHPVPVVIIEGLHALYPEFLPYLDFTLYVDPSRSIKWQWKYERDMKKRGHQAEKLVEEMLLREAAYKRWIDFQKTNARIVIKIFESQMQNMARYELLHRLPPHTYKVEMIMEPSGSALTYMPITIDLSSAFETKEQPFMFSAVPGSYWGKKMVTVHIDGVISEKTVSELEKHIENITGISVDDGLKAQFSPTMEQHEKMTATQFAQLVITWRFLEQIHLINA